VPPDPGADAEASELGRWLAQDLRTKGVPSEAAIPELPSVHQKRIVEAEQPDNSSWRVPQLRVRGSSLPPDSLSPQEISAAVAPEPAPAADLEDEDLAVLPSLAGLPKARQPMQALMGVGVLLTLAIGGGWWWGRGQIIDESGDAATVASPHIVAAPLPPPPPDVLQEQDPDEQNELEPAQVPPTSVATKASGGETALDSKLPEPGRPETLGPRGRRSGDSVARFADLPSPTLSRLSKDERQEARSRDDGVRATVRASSAQK
jgi:hypothetical protein